MIDIATRPLPLFWPAPLAEDFCERLGKIEIPWHFGNGVDRVDLAKAAANDEVGAPASRGVSITSCMLAGRARALSGDRSAVAYPAMPIVLKTPAHPAVLFPPAMRGGGTWHIEREVAGMRALYRAANGGPHGAALSGVCVREKDLVAKQLPALLAPVPHGLLAPTPD